MTPLFNKLHHVCIVVNDLDKAVAYYEALGVGPWFDYPKSGTYVEFEVPSKAASEAMRYRCVDLEDVQIQLCDPGPLDSPQRRFLEQNGEGLYHLGFEVPNLDEAKATGRSLGLSVIARGKRVDNSGFCYFDTRRDAGVVLEIRKTSASLPTRAAGT